MPVTQQKDRLATIDLLRGLAASTVAWFHFTRGNPTFLERGALRSSGAYGWLGVEVFFVISGFIIPFSLYRGRYQLRLHWKRFVAKRIIRLDPPYLACIVLAVLLTYASAAAPGFRGEPPHFTWTQLALHLGYLNAFFGGDWVNPVFWTLAVEFQFYLIIAFLYPLLVHPQKAVRLAVLAAVAGASIAIPSMTLVFQWLCLFALGIISFQYFVGLTDRRGYFLSLAAMGAVCYAVLGAQVTIVGILAALVITFVRVRGTRMFSFLGAISYSLYLLHVPIGGRVVNLGMRLAPTLMNRVLTLIGASLATLIAAYLFFRFIELPAQRWSSRIKYVSPSGSLASGPDAASAFIPTAPRLPATPLIGPKDPDPMPYPTQSMPQ